MENLTEKEKSFLLKVIDEYWSVWDKDHTEMSEESELSDNIVKKLKN